MNKNKIMQFINSWWILLAFVWLINWTAFLFVGIKAKNKKWIVWSCFYFVFGFVVPILSGQYPNNALLDYLMWIFFISWLGGIVHAFILRKKYLEAISIFDTKNTSLENDRSMAPVNKALGEEDQKRLQNYYSNIIQIKRKFTFLQTKAAAKPKFLFVSRFLSQFGDEIANLDKLYEQFSSALNVSSKYRDISTDIKFLEEKLVRSSEDAREFLLKALDEKKAALQESENIRTLLETSESKLYYIVSVFDKIELIIESNDLSDDVVDENSDSLNSQLSVFSENLKSALDSMKI